MEQSNYKTAELSPPFIGLRFENNNWYIAISELSDTIKVSSALKSSLIKLLEHYDCLDFTDKDHLLLIKPYDSIYHSIFNCMDMLMGFCKYSGKLSNILKSDKTKPLFEHLHDKKVSIMCNTYPDITTVDQNSLNEVLDKILEVGIENLNVVENKILELNSKL